MDKNEYAKMVRALMKSGEIMRNEWTNKDKEIFKCISNCIQKASDLWVELNHSFMPLSESCDYELHHMTLGLNGELGELLDAYKKAVVYQKSLDNKNIIEEFGDLIFYMTGIQIVVENNVSRYRDVVHMITDLCEEMAILSRTCEISTSEAMEANFEKLGERYKGHQYSDDQAKQRKDKNFVNISLSVAGQTINVSFFPDIPKVCYPETMDVIDVLEADCEHKFDQELLVQICQSKIEKEGK